MGNNEWLGRRNLEDIAVGCQKQVCEKYVSNNEWLGRRNLAFEDIPVGCQNQVCETVLGNNEWLGRRELANSDIAVGCQKQLCEKYVSNNEWLGRRNLEDIPVGCQNYISMQDAVGTFAIANTNWSMIHMLVVMLFCALSFVAGNYVSKKRHNNVYLELTEQI